MAYTFSVSAPTAQTVAIANPTLVRADRVDPRPDVVIVSLDTVRADRLEVYGGAAATSPALLGMAPEAAVFTHAFSAAPWTLPSHVSLFTGQYPQRHGVSKPTRRVPVGRVPVLAQSLRDAGYETIGVTSGGFVGPKYGLATGFERYTTADPMEREGSLVRRGRQHKEDLLELLAERGGRPRLLFVHTFVGHNYLPDDEALRAVGATADEIATLERELLRLPREERVSKVEGAPSDETRRTAGCWSSATTPRLGWPTGSWETSWPRSARVMTSTSSSCPITARS